MDLKALQGPYNQQPADCIILGLYEDEEGSINQHPFKDRIEPLIKSDDIELKLGKTALLLGPPHLVVVGLGKRKNLDTAGFLKAVANSAAAIPHTVQHLICTLTELEVGEAPWRFRHAARQVVNQTYKFTETKSEKEKIKLHQLERIDFTGAGGSGEEKSLLEGQTIAESMHITRELGNLPSNICTPTYLAEQAQKLSKEFRHLTCEVLEEKHMKKLGMGAFLSVTQGSNEPAKLILLHYQNGEPNQAPLALVGKGVTFDSGGISLKPGAQMDEMKYDMCGAASVFGTMRAIAKLELPLNIICAIAATENMPGPDATKPGDIVTTLSGKTVEILNTDAEGRLILCDTLSYVERYNPTTVIDVATLTGLMVLTMGNVASGVFTNHQPLAEDLIKAGQSAGDKVWQFPIWEEYQQLLESNFADIPNIGPREAGSITAACFLSKFTEKFQWAHLDIAGSAWDSGKRKGATGRPVPLLMEYLLSQC